MAPIFDPVGILAAIVSATLFTIAIVYAVRSRATDIDTSFMDALVGPASRPPRELFAGSLIESRFPASAFLLSALLHLCVALGTPLLTYLFPEELRFDYRRYNVKIVDFHVPTPLFYTSPSSAAPERTPARQAARSATRATGKSQIARAPGPPAPRARLQLPSSAQASSKDVVIQPDQPSDILITLPSPLPAMFLWARQPAPLEMSHVLGAPPKPNLQKFTLPQSNPRVQKPNRETIISDLQLGAAPALTEQRPRLPVPAANISPLQVPAPPVEAPKELPASALAGGNPTNLISSMTTPAPPAPGYIVELGNRPAAPQPGGNPQPAAQPASSAPETSASRPGATDPSRPAAPNNPASPDSILPSLVPSDSSGTGRGPSSTDNRSEKALNKPSGALDRKGNMGIVIVQQSALESGLEGAEILTGQPIYTVFFAVAGAPRKWILQYCVPKSTAPPATKTDEAVIRIAPKRTIQPPFPLETTPVDTKGLQGQSRPLVVYATVNERGETGNVRLIRGTGQDVDTIALAALRRWVFRPAMRGDTPVAIEALFGIPLQ